MAVETKDVAAYAVRVALQGVKQRAQIHYTQGPDRWWGIHNGSTGLNQPAWADCSSYTTWIFWQARRHMRGAPGDDVVNGQDWKSGYTGTHLEHGHIHEGGVDHWHAGRTLVFYGKPTVGHVALYVGDGMVVSHGSESGPVYVRWDYRNDWNRSIAYPL
jgi:cell wall-associated NlpC family hydrolase